MSSGAHSSYSIKELLPWATGCLEGGATACRASTGTVLLQGHALSTPAHHKPWDPLSVPSSWRPPPWETHKCSTRCCCSWVCMKTLCLSSVHCSQKLREMLWSCFFHMSPLLSHFWAREWEKMFCENHWNEDYRGRKYVRSITITLCAGFTYSKEGKGLDQGNRAEHQKHPGRCAQRWDVFLQAAALLGMRWLWNRAWIYPTFLAQSDAFISLFRQMRVGVTFQIPPVWRGVSGVQK